MSKRKEKQSQKENHYDYMDNENSTTTEESEGDEDTRHLDVMKKEVAIAKAHMLTHLQEFRYECREL